MLITRRGRFESISEKVEALEELGRAIVLFCIHTHESVDSWIGHLPFRVRMKKGGNAPTEFFSSPVLSEARITASCGDVRHNVAVFKSKLGSVRVCVSIQCELAAVARRRWTVDTEVVRRCLSHCAMYTCCTDRSWGSSVCVRLAGPYGVLSMPGHTLFSRVTEDSMHVVIYAWLFDTHDHEMSLWQSLRA